MDVEYEEKKTSQSLTQVARDLEDDYNYKDPYDT